MLMNILKLFIYVFGFNGFNINAENCSDVLYIHFFRLIKISKIERNKVHIYSARTLNAVKSPINKPNSEYKLDLVY